jgi:hypothetical protein
MAKVFIEETTLTNIGDAIRAKTGKTELIDPALMGEEITSIEAGSGGGVELPEEALNITGNCTYRFYSGAWDWFISAYGNRVTTTSITTLLGAFAGSDAEEIPFIINVSNCSTLNTCFNQMEQLKKSPKIRGTLKVSASLNFDDCLSNCKNVRDFEDLFESSVLDGINQLKITSASSAPGALKFKQCSSLRAVPSWWHKFMISKESTAIPTSTNKNIYYAAFEDCTSLDEILNIPVYSGSGTLASNMFKYSFDDTSRAKACTFETNSGQPLVSKWKAQVIDLTTMGYASSFNLSLNHGITSDKKVEDDATYQALKNDPDWFTTKMEYSRYNHDSAVETINSLPDTSAYLATAGGTNTIKFKKAAGSKTDGGAIETLTAEEIAVAAAKGWTVTMS